MKFLQDALLLLVNFHRRETHREESEVLFDVADAGKAE